MIALITGASSGIGEATARRLAREPDMQLILVARREEKLRALADELGGATVIGADLTEAVAPQRIAEIVEREHGRLELLINNAGGAWRARFADGGYADVRRHMEINFDATVRLTEALLPILRRSSPSAIVNLSSVAGRVGRANSGAYSASKFALIGWTDSVHGEEKPNGVHVGLVLPGFIATPGFPQSELRANALTRWIVSTPEKVAEAIVDVGINRRAERYVPRPYWVFAAMRLLTPALVRRLTSGGGPLTPATTSSPTDQKSG